MRILVTGGSGYLGGEVTRQSSAAGHQVAATYLGRPNDVGANWHLLDVRRRTDVAGLIRRFRPSVVIHTAFRKADWETTADGAAHVALAAAEAGTRLVHISSDAVFSGSAIHYEEGSLPDPITPYGAAKAAAETAVKAIHPTALIVRTSLILGDGRSPHESFVHGLAAGSRGVLFTDVVRCPIHVSDLAAAILELAASDHTGVAHLAGTDALSRHELGILIAGRDGFPADRLAAGKRGDQHLPGPLDVRLVCTDTQGLLRTRLRGAREFLRPPT